MGKRGFVVIFLIVIVLGGLNLFLYFDQGGVSYAALSGMVVDELNVNLNPNINLSTIIFISQWVLLMLIVLIAFVKHLKGRKSEAVRINYSELKNKKTKANTDLDILYKILKDRKKLKVSVIASTFKITREQALEWGRILENYNLASIEYPAFSQPEIILKEKKVKHEEEETKEGKEKRKSEKTKTTQEIKKVGKAYKKEEKFGKTFKKEGIGKERTTKGAGKTGKAYKKEDIRGKATGKISRIKRK